VQVQQYSAVAPPQQAQDAYTVQLQAQQAQQAQYNQQAAQYGAAQAAGQVPTGAGQTQQFVAAGAPQGHPDPSGQGGRMTRQRQRLPNAVAYNPAGGVADPNTQHMAALNAVTMGGPPVMHHTMAPPMGAMTMQPGAVQQQPAHNPNPGSAHVPRMTAQQQQQVQQAQQQQVQVQLQVQPPVVGVPQQQLLQGGQPVMALTAPGGDVPSTDPNYICPVCHDAFGDEQSLSRHAARSHARDNPQRAEPLQCSQCTATLANPQNLRRHIAVCHSGERTGPLRRGTSSGVAKAANPNRKPKTAKVFVCALCPTGTTFRWKGNLKRHHQLIHLQAKPYKCDVCNEAFGTKSNREVHMIVHQTDKGEMQAARGAAAAAAAGGVVQNAAAAPGGQAMGAGPGMAVPPLGVAAGMGGMPGTGMGSVMGPPVNGLGGGHPGQPQGVGVNVGVPIGMAGMAPMGMGAIPQQVQQVHQPLGDQEAHGIKYER
jgi:hypothetical protein